MMRRISGLPAARQMRSSSCLAEPPRAAIAIASKTILLLVASATVRFVAVAILEVPIAAEPRWFVLVCLLASDVRITKEGAEIKSDFKGMPALDAVLVAAAQVTSRTKSTGPRHSLA
jgi:hypothetical protein